MNARKRAKTSVAEALRKKLPLELARYMRDLPPPLELAKLAAVVGPREDWEEAIRNAAKLYWLAADFCERFQGATPKERAVLFEDWPAALLCDGIIERLFGADFEAIKAKARIRASVPPLETETATRDDFLVRVVKGKTVPDSAKRLRDFFRSVCPTGENQEDYAERWMKKLNEEGFTNNNLLWEELGVAYRRWWTKRVAEQNRKNRQKK